MRSRLWPVLVAVALASAACSEQPLPGPEAATSPAIKSQELRAQWYQDCWKQFNDKQWDQFQLCYSENAVSEAPDQTPSSATGRVAIIDRAKAEAIGFPDRRGEVRLMLVNNDHAASIALYTGTNTGEMTGPDGQPQKATGKPIGLLIGHVIDFDSTGSRAVRDADYVEQATLNAQLGLSKAVARKAEKPGGAPAIVVLAKNDAKESANLTTARAMYDALNRHDMNAYVGLMADDYKLVEVSEPKDMDRQAAFTNTSVTFAGFPDLNISAASIWAAGDYVAVEGSVAGTNTGDMPSMGLKKTGKKINVRFFQVMRFEGGKIKEDWFFYNGAAFAAQLGAK